MEIATILNQMRQRGFFAGVKRYQYAPYSLSRSLQVVQAIGKERDPSFIIDDDNRFAYEQAIKWVHGDPSMLAINPATGSTCKGNLNAGLYIGGDVGRGKSWLLEIMAAYCTIDNVQVGIEDENYCLCWRGTTYRAADLCDEYATTGDVSKFKRAKVLALQDVGAEPAETLYMGNRMDVVKQVLEDRGDHRDRLTLITSNLPITSQVLEDRYGERVASRLQEMCNYLTIRGDDRRKI